MPNRCIEIHDSVLNGIAISGHISELHFSSVYIHQSDGKPGVDQGVGWFQEAVLRIFGARTPDSLPQFPIDLMDGQTVLGQLVSENEIPYPLNHQGKFELRLIPKWHPDEVLSFIGTGADLTLIGEPSEVEKFPRS
ncbi:MAG TPA: hypothetical protein VFI38_03335 [Candidatus Acidoferrum sp.]|nr:hypothetical protein [Candidatus Acidoferrum sp.]